MQWPERLPQHPVIVKEATTLRPATAKDKRKTTFQPLLAYDWLPSRVKLALDFPNAFGNKPDAIFPMGRDFKNNFEDLYIDPTYADHVQRNWRKCFLNIIC